MNIYNKNERNCCVCKKQLHGRRDKRFCDISCKNEYHRRNRTQLKILKLKRIQRNITVSEGIIGRINKKITLHQSKLFKLGFDVLCFQNIPQKNNEWKQLLNFEFKMNTDGFVTIRRLRESEVTDEVIFDRWKLDLIDFKPEKTELIRRFNDG